MSEHDTESRARSAKLPTVTVGDMTYEASRKDGAFHMRAWLSDRGQSEAFELSDTSQAPAQALALFKVLAS